MSNVSCVSTLCVCVAVCYVCGSMLCSYLVFIAVYLHLSEVVDEVAKCVIVRGRECLDQFY